MAKYHEYTGKITVQLPDGHYIKDGEILEEGDLHLSDDGPPEQVKDRRQIGAKAINFHWSRYYRPDPIVY
jgi:hypothetical protein